MLPICVSQQLLEVLESRQPSFGESGAAAGLGAASAVGSADFAFAGGVPGGGFGIDGSAFGVGAALLRSGDDPPCLHSPGTLVCSVSDLVPCLHRGQDQ